MNSYAPTLRIQHHLPLAIQLEVCSPFFPVHSAVVGINTCVETLGELSCQRWLSSYQDKVIHKTHQKLHVGGGREKENERGNYNTFTIKYTPRYHMAGFFKACLFHGWLLPNHFQEIKNCTEATLIRLCFQELTLHPFWGKKWYLYYE